MAIKSVLKNWASNKVGGALDKGLNIVSGISDPKDPSFGNTIRARYPIDLMDNSRYGEFIKFTMHDYKATPEKEKNNPEEGKVGDTVSSAISDLKSSVTEELEGGTLGSIRQQKLADIYMYIPAQSMVNSTQIDWETKEAGVLIDMDMANMTSGKIASVLAKAKGKDMASAISGGIGSAIEKVRGETLTTSNVQSFFTGIGLRKFSFAFEFAPRSEAELRNALLIYETFKKYSLPVRTEDYKFKYPNAWKFALHSTESGKVLPLMGSDKCYINSITSNLSPDSVWSTFNNGYPVNFNMVVSLVEDRVMDRNDYDNADYELK